jgi:hypothetical protein
VSGDEFSDTRRPTSSLRPRVPGMANKQSEAARLNPEAPHLDGSVLAWTGAAMDTGRTFAPARVLRGSNGVHRGSSHPISHSRPLDPVRQAVRARWLRRFADEKI